MVTQPRKRLIFNWTTPKNLLAILLFIIIAILIQYIIIALTIPMGTEDSTTIALPIFNITLSFLYHLFPSAVIISLTASFIHLTIHTATVPAKTQTLKKPHRQEIRKKPTRLKPLRKFYKKLRRATRKIKNKILKTPTIAYIERRVILARAIIKSAITITATFIIIILLVTIAAYPKFIPTATANFYQWNAAFLSFVTSTIRASETVANTIPPIGAIATTIQNALIAAAPAFHNTLEGTASTITNGLVSLSSTEKYLIIQNTAAWTVAIITLLYSQYIKIRRYRR